MSRFIGGSVTSLRWLIHLKEGHGSKKLKIPFNLTYIPERVALKLMLSAVTVSFACGLCMTQIL